MPHRVTHHSEAERKAIAERQEKEVANSSEYIVQTRSEDHSFLLKLSYQFEKYRVLFYIILGGLIAFGFDFKTPAQNNKILSDRIEQVAKENQAALSEVSKQTAAAEVSRTNIERKIDMLIMFRCIDQNKRDMILAGIDCTEYDPYKRGKTK
jgi:hypothetical protein